MNLIHCLLMVVRSMHMWPNRGRYGRPVTIITRAPRFSKKRKSLKDSSHQLSAIIFFASTILQLHMSFGELIKIFLVN